MKKIVTALSFCLACIGSSTAYASSLERPSIYINNEKLEMFAAVPPSGSTLVPFREIFDTLGMEVSWDEATKSVTATKSGVNIKLQAGSHDGYLNGKKVYLAQTPALEGNVFYVNLRFVAEAVGAAVAWKKVSDSEAEIHISLPHATPLVDEITIHSIVFEEEKSFTGYIIDGRAYVDLYGILSLIPFPINSKAVGYYPEMKTLRIYHNDFVDNPIPLFEFQVGKKEFLADGVIVEMDHEILIMNDRIHVPLEDFIAHQGFKLTYHSAANDILISK